jgi:hypothetical protein
MELLNQAQWILIIVETAFLGWAMIVTIGSTKKNRSQQFFSMKMVVGLCGILSLLYIAEFILYDPSFMNAFITIIWGGCSILWGRTLKGSPKKHELEDELKVLKGEVKEQMNKMFR